LLNSIKKLRPFKPFLHRALYIVDALVLAISLSIAWWTKVTKDAHFTTPFFDYLLILLGLIPLLLIAFYTFDLYASRRGQNYFGEMIKIIEANIITFVLLFGLLFIFKFTYVSRALVLHWAVLNALIGIVVRYAFRIGLRYIRVRGYNVKYMLVIGAGKLGQQFLAKIERHREFGYVVKGFLDDDDNKHNKRFKNVRVIGDLDILEEYLQSTYIDEVIVALPLRAYQKLEEIIATCEKYGIRTLIIPDYYKYIPAKPKVLEFVGMPLIHTRDIPLDIFINRFCKRCFDIIGSILLLILFSPVMLVVAAVVKLSSRGPLLFKQKRIGLDRKPFAMYKFRSMRVAKEEVAATTWTMQNDPRRTKIGELIRGTSLDELPQFFNVLRGDMSLIGPRPERPHFVEKFKQEIPRYMVKHQVKPGITGWAQVNGWRGDTSIEERIKCDIYYIEHWSLWLDMKILFLTVFKGFVNRNAY
jgi:Undecaprenyl-phosphate glucose phosphotransferase